VTSNFILELTDATAEQTTLRAPRKVNGLLTIFLNNFFD